MSEAEFVAKYFGIINKIHQQFDNRAFADEKKIEKLSGYNNATVSILELINPIYKYDLEE
jgi:hypothetical protein